MNIEELLKKGEAEEVPETEIAGIEELIEYAKNRKDISVGTKGTTLYVEYTPKGTRTTRTENDGPTKIKVIEYPESIKVLDVSRGQYIELEEVMRDHYENLLSLLKDISYIVDYNGKSYKIGAPGKFASELYVGIKKEPNGFENKKEIPLK